MISDTANVSPPITFISMVSLFYRPFYFVSCSAKTAYIGELVFRIGQAVCLAGFKEVLGIF